MVFFGALTSVVSFDICFYYGLYVRKPETLMITYVRYVELLGNPENHDVIGISLPTWW